MENFSCTLYIINLVKGKYRKNSDVLHDHLLSSGAAVEEPTLEVKEDRKPDGNRNSLRKKYCST